VENTDIVVENYTQLYPCLLSLNHIIRILPWQVKLSYWPMHLNGMFIESLVFKLMGNIQMDLTSCCNRWGNALICLREF
jgi:hypothetical protein